MATKKSSGASKSTSQATPNFDLSQWFGSFNIPGLDVQEIMENNRKDWESLQEAMQTANQGWQALAQRQQELMQSAVQQWQEDISAGLTRSPEENADVFRQRMEQGLQDMQSMVEQITQSQNEAGEILRKRFEENMARLTGR